MPTLYIFRGPPATGKSTKRAQMLAADPELRYVNKDELREQCPSCSERDIHGEQMGRMAVWAEQGRSIIIDNTNLNRGTVDSYLSWAQKHGYTTETISFGQDVPYDTAVYWDWERGQRGGRTVGRSVIWQFYVDAGLAPVWPERKKVILFDIDGTLANIEHRRPLLEGVAGKKDWAAFNGAMHLDTPNPAVQLVYDALVCAGHGPGCEGRIHRAIFMSGRGSEFRSVTEEWLDDNECSAYELLLMRPWRDNRPDHVIKRELYETYVAPWYDVELVFDDRDSVVALWRELGLPCFQVAPGNF